MNKTNANLLKTTLSVVLIVIVLFTVFGGLFNKPPSPMEIKPSNPPQNNITDNEFMIGAMDAGYDFFYDYIPQLNMNAWHKYTEAVPIDAPHAKGWYDIYGALIETDRYDKAIGQYSSQVSQIIDANRTWGMRSIMDRPKTGYLAFGQRSDYQCEREDHLADQDYKFYTYNTSIHDPNLFITDITDGPPYGEGEIVKQCLMVPNSPGSNAQYIVSGLKANHEQANDQYGFMKGDDQCKWYVMPRVRIDPSVVVNSPETPVCRIDILDWNGNPVPECPNGKIIYAKYFAPLGNPNHYTGEYLNEYYFDQIQNETPSPIIINERNLCPVNSLKHFTDWPPDPLDAGYIHTDFRVYWYGNCNMWIDRIRVENEPAHKLFETERQYWEQQIRDEVYQLALRGYENSGYVPNVFWQEEMEFNCLPCIKKVNEIIQDEASQYGVDLSLIVNLNYNLFKVHIPYCWGNDMTSAQLKKYLVDSGKVKIIAPTCYPLQGYTYDKHPSTLSTLIYNRYNGILSNPTSPIDYDNWLQNVLDSMTTGQGCFSKVLKLCDGVTKISTGTRIISLHQNYLWWSSDEGANHKEPSNEEMNLLANLAISYGAKGLLSYVYKSWNLFTDPVGYVTGLTEPCPENQVPQRRLLNVYGQPKWQAMIEINNRLKLWGGNLMSFNNTQTNSYIYRLVNERDDLINNSYFFDIVTYKPGSPPIDCTEDDPGGDLPPNLIYECKHERYIQVATFQNNNTENAQYFPRCWCCHQQQT